MDGKGSSSPISGPRASSIDLEKHPAGSRPTRCMVIKHKLCLESCKRAYDGEVSACDRRVVHAQQRSAVSARQKILSYASFYSLCARAKAVKSAPCQACESTSRAQLRPPIARTRQLVALPTGASAGGRADQEWQACIGRRGDAAPIMPKSSSRKRREADNVG